MTIRQTINALLEAVADEKNNLTLDSDILTGLPGLGFSQEEVTLDSFALVETDPETPINSVMIFPYMSQFEEGMVYRVTTDGNNPKALPLYHKIREISGEEDLAHRLKVAGHSQGHPVNPKANDLDECEDRYDNIEDGGRLGKLQDISEGTHLDPNKDFDELAEDLNASHVPSDDGDHVFEGRFA